MQYALHIEIEFSAKRIFLPNSLFSSYFNEITFNLVITMQIIIHKKIGNTHLTDNQFIDWFKMKHFFSQWVCCMICDCVVEVSIYLIGIGVKNEYLPWMVFFFSYISQHSSRFCTLCKCKYKIFDISNQSNNWLFEKYIFIVSYLGEINCSIQSLLNTRQNKIYRPYICVLVTVCIAIEAVTETDILQTEKLKYK